MLVPLLIKNGIRPICTVRRHDQVSLLIEEYGDKIEIVDTSLPYFKTNMTNICMRHRPSSCLECIAGDFTGMMLEFMGFKSTLILYGLLSDKPAGNIQAINFLGKAQTIESFLLMAYIGTKSKEWYQQMIYDVQQMYKNELKTQVNAKFGFQDIEKAIQFYMKNQTSGKVVLKPCLTPEGQLETAPIRLDKHFAKL